MSPSPTPQMLAHCPLCQAAYEQDAVRLVSEPAPLLEKGSTRMFHLTCKSCHHAVLAVVSESNHGVSSVGLVTDLEAQDALRMQDATCISADDVVRAHLELESKSREMCKELMKL